jgi:hypothetical protein
MTETTNACADFGDALGVLAKYVTKAELLQALWMVIRIHDRDDDRPMAFTLTLLVHQINTVRRLEGNHEPVTLPVHCAALRDQRKPAAERVALACASAYSLQSELIP